MLSVFALAGLASCSDDDFDYTPAGAVTGAQVYFSNQTVTSYTITEEANSFSIPVIRGNVAGALQVPLSVKVTDNNNIYTVPNSVSFNDGDSLANIVVNYDPTKIEYGVYDTLTIAIDSAMITPYGVSEIKVVAGATAWVDYGMAQYRDDLIIFYNVGNPMYEVPIQKNIVKEGYYRLVNPYGEWYPYNETYDDGTADWDQSVDSYMVINATDPDYVFVEDCETTMDWGKGVISIYGYVYYLMLNGNDLETIKSARPDLFGTLKDGVITMPAQSLLINMPGYNESNPGAMYYSNPNGLFAVVLPGYTMADYSAEVSYAGTFTDARNNVFAVGNLTLGEDVKTVKAVVMEAGVDAAAVADAIAAGDLDAVDVAAGRIEVPIAEGLSGKLQLIAVVLAGGEVKTVATANFEYFGGGVNPWKNIGVGMFVDDIVLPLFGYDPEPYPVEIEENTETPGLYRLVDAYAILVSEFGEVGGYENIEVHAEDPEGVYILESRLGWDAGYGDMMFISEGGRYVAGNGFDVVKRVRPDLLGTVKDGVITFPVFAAPSGLNYQGLLFMGEDGYYVGTNGAFEIYLPSALKSNAQLQARVKGQKQAAEFSKRLKNGYKVGNVRPAFSKKMVKDVKMLEMF